MTETESCREGLRQRLIHVERERDRVKLSRQPNPRVVSKTKKNGNTNYPLFSEQKIKQSILIVAHMLNIQYFNVRLWRVYLIRWFLIWGCAPTVVPQIFAVLVRELGSAIEVSKSLQEI